MKTMAELARFFRRFTREGHGGVLIIFGLSVALVVAIGGASIDLGIQQLMRAKLQNASDAAATSAAGLHAANYNVTNVERQSAAVRYFNLNYPPEFYGQQRPVPSVSINNTITVSAQGAINTAFVSNFGISQLQASALSVVSVAQSAPSDFDLVIVVDESSSEYKCLNTPYVQGAPPNYAVGSCPPGDERRIDQMKVHLTQLVTNLQSATNPNPNIRIGFVGYSRVITNKWGLSSNRSDSLTAINWLLGNPNTRYHYRFQNFDHVGMRGAARMLMGGTGGTQNMAYFNSQNRPTTTNGTTWPAVMDPMSTTTAMPVPQTARTSTNNDAHGLSPLKYVIFITDGEIMMEPTAQTTRGTEGPNPPVLSYDQTVQGLCPHANEYVPYGTGWVPSSTNTGPCYQALANECTALKNLFGPGSVRLFVANYIEPPGAAATTLSNCASTNPVTGAPDYKYAPTAAEFGIWLQDVITQIQAVRIQE